MWRSCSDGGSATKEGVVPAKRSASRDPYAAAIMIRKDEVTISSRQTQACGYGSRRSPGRHRVCGSSPQEHELRVVIGAPLQLFEAFGRLQRGGGRFLDYDQRRW